MIIIKISVVLFVISGLTIRIEEFSHYSNILFLLGGLIPLLITLIHKKSVFLLNVDSIFIIYIMFIFFSFISAIFNQDINSFNSTIKLLMLYMVTVVMIYNNKELITAKHLINLVMFAFVVILSYSVIEYPIESLLYTYSGVFDNTNSMGMLAASMFVISILAIQQYRGLIRYFYVIFVGISVFFIIVSGSRTAFLTMLGIILILLTYYIYIWLKEGKIKTLKFKHFLLIVILIFAMIILFNNEDVNRAFDTNIIEKFNNKSDDITSARTNIWGKIITNAGFTGQGSNYIKEETGLTAHNSFLAIMIEFGWIPGILYIIFWVIALVKSIKVSIAQRNLLTMLLIGNFLLLSMMEVLTVHSSALVAMYVLGYLYNDINIKKRMEVT